jgi:myo-inositol-1(or 4)-monophosphatase
MGPLPAGSLNSRFLAAQAIAREAGLLALRYLDDPEKLDVQLKGPQDFVTAADRAVEALIARRLADAFPDDAFLGEESFAASSPSDAEMLWVVDPIDGTANFVRAGSDWCVSIGLICRGEPVLGAIFHPASSRLYVACRGHGATVEGEPIRVSGRGGLAGATVAIDYSARTPPERHAGQIRSILERGAEYRRNCCCTLSLAAVAAGRLDGFAELHLSVWDVAAAIVLVREAGGWTNDFMSGAGLTEGGPFVACTPSLRPELLRALGMQELR